MSTNKKILRTPRTANARLRRVRPATANNNNDSRAISQVCGLVDPFCEHSYGAKIPDDSNTRTLPYTFHQEQIFASDANGAFGTLIAPYVSVSPWTVSIVTGDVMTQTAFSPASIALLTGVSSYRVVTAGYKVKNIAPALTASGMIAFRSFGQANAVSLSSVTGNTYTASCTRNVPLKDLQDTTVIIPRNSAVPTIFYDVVNTERGGVITDCLSNGFNFTTVFGYGLPASTPCVLIEFIYHVEFLFGDAAALGLAATPSVPFNPILSAAAAKLNSTAELIYHESKEYASEYVKRAAFAALKGLATSYSGPLGFAAKGGMLLLGN